MYNLNKEKIVKLYQEGNSCFTVGKIIGVGDETIRRVLISSNVPRLSLSESKKGKRNYNYKRMFSKETRRKMSEATKGEKHPFFNQIGEKCHNWKGDKAGNQAGRARAKKIFIALKCEKCGDTRTENKNLHRHHKDENPLNNNPGNIQILCNSCHGKLHGRLRLFN